MNIFDVTIIGVGRLGGALALALSEKGYQISQLVARNRENAETVSRLINPTPRVIGIDEFDGILSDIIFITSQDDEIEEIVRNLANRLEQMPVVYHVSGALSSDLLSPLRELGCEVGSFHPMISVSDPVVGSGSFKDAFICLEGDQEAVFIGKKIAETLGGKPFSIDAKYKPLYHAAAVTASGHLVALISMAIEMLTKCNLPEYEAQKILLPLINSTLNNLSTQQPHEALTGTFARGDLNALNSHLEALRQNVSEQIFRTYLQLGEHSIDLAAKRGSNRADLENLRSALRSARFR